MSKTAASNSTWQATQRILCLACWLALLTFLLFGATIMWALGAPYNQAIGYLWIVNEFFRVFCGLLVFVWCVGLLGAWTASLR